ncbi:MAG: nucleotide exchange factor GrpE [Pseudomonadota bacterium]
MNDENKQPEDNAEENVQDSTEENVVNLDQPSELEDALTEGALSADDHIAKLEQELIDNRERTMRALADAENTRKRAMKDREDAGKFAIARFAKDLLDFSDNFGRALSAIPEDIKETDERIKSVVDGIEAMEAELMAVFERNGVTKITPLDEKFDANYHEVMFEAPMPGKEAGVIIQVVEPGYVLNDRLLRAAKVGIAKADEGAPPTTDPGANIDESA